MSYKKVTVLIVVLLFWCVAAFAEDLAAGEAVNYFNEGVKAQKGGNFEMAESNYSKAILLAPYSPKWRKYIFNNMGSIYLEFGDLDKAEASFKESLKMDPEFMPAKVNLGLVYDRRRSRLESLEYWFKTFDMEKLIPKRPIIAEADKKEK